MPRSVFKSHTNSVLCIFLSFHLPVMLPWEWDQTAQDPNAPVRDRNMLWQELFAMLFKMFNYVIYLDVTYQ